MGIGSDDLAGSDSIVTEDTGTPKALKKMPCHRLRSWQGIFIATSLVFPAYLSSTPDPPTSIT